MLEQVWRNIFNDRADVRGYDVDCSHCLEVHFRKGDNLSILDLGIKLSQFQEAISSPLLYTIRVEDSTVILEIETPFSAQEAELEGEPEKPMQKKRVKKEVQEEA